MPIYGGRRQLFVQWIECRRSVARGIGHVRRRALGAQESLQALVYDATFRSDREAVAFYYCTANDHFPDLDAPTWINEKIRWQFLNHPNPLISLAADKLAVRDYLRWKGAVIEPPRLIASGSDPAELEGVDLPDRFVLKTSCASGQNEIVAQGGESISRAALIATLRRWMRYDFWRRNGELHYRDIPKRWLVEEYVPAEREKVEFKAICFHGEPFCFLVVAQRNHGGVRGRSGIRLAFYDTEWNRLDLGLQGIPEEPAPVPRPAELPLLISEARRLSADFMHVRVDFLKFDGRLTFSELTFACDGARRPYTPATMNATFGSMMDLDRAPAYLELGRRTVRAMQRPLAA